MNSRSLTGCQKNNVENSDTYRVKVKKLKMYHTLLPNNNLVVGMPIRLKYHNKHLFIQDLAKQSVIELNDSNKVVHTFGRKGRGPGEVTNMESFFITPKYLFIVDGGQFLINKYNLRNGHYLSSLDYGQLLIKRKVSSKNKIPPTPQMPWMDNNNKVFITLNGRVLLPTQINGKFLYEEVNWEGKKIGTIGAIPKGYKPTTDKNKYWSTIENEKVPAGDLAETFPVNDRADPNDIYLVYSAIPEIAKYSLSGKKIWEHKIPKTPEVDTLMINLRIMAKVVKNHPTHRIALVPVRKYVAGRCSPNGDLYLTTYTDGAMPLRYHRPIWIHQFNPEGKLVKRYKIVSKANVDLSFYPGINFKRHKVFVALVLNNNGIRNYHF